MTVEAGCLVFLMATLPVPVPKKTERNKTKPWNIKQDYYDNGDEEELTITQLTGRQRLYRKQQQYNTEANKKLPAQPPMTVTAKKQAQTLPMAKNEEGS